MEGLRRRLGLWSTTGRAPFNFHCWLSNPLRLCLAASCAAFIPFGFVPRPTTVRYCTPIESRTPKWQLCLPSGHLQLISSSKSHLFDTASTLLFVYG
ncbi:hypothetical protein N658DRAFT_170525 [Parathielavia hyrcaniae]|uniref:Uncharacterized protein n=1 Tax=Parathielavia hyrcaniae TaxID=113614 RepID=A0AAN6SZ58_9PEZI|nr:hypothetical protein N658DRAFT_170525 [Parathielavia hyrcaniae]